MRDEDTATDDTELWLELELEPTSAAELDEDRAPDKAELWLELELELATEPGDCRFPDEADPLESERGHAES